MRPERLERLAQDTCSGLESVRYSLDSDSNAAHDVESRYKVEELKGQLERLLNSPRFPRLKHW